MFAHQFSSIAGAGPVTGAIQAAAFGWLPVLLWVLIGGVFFGAVTDFGALYASVKNDGKSMGLLIEKYIGKTGRKLFLLFCWLFCGIVIAAFADMVAGTFNAYGADGALVDAAQTNGAAGMVSIMFMVFAVVFGLIQKKFNFSGWKESVISIVFIVLSFVIGANLPIILGKAAWSYITFVYIFFAAVLPMWLLKQPRDHMTTFMFVAMIAGAVVGLVVAHPTMNLPVYTGFTNEKLGTMFPILFVTIACGAISGFHSLVASGTTSKQLDREAEAQPIAYGGMLIECVLALVSLCAVAYIWQDYKAGTTVTPTVVFATGLSQMLGKIFGSGAVSVTYTLMVLAVSVFCLTSLDTATRLARYMFQEFWLKPGEKAGDPTVTGARKVLCNPYVSTAITVVLGIALGMTGYAKIWPLFGAANQLLAGLGLLAVAAWLGKMGRNNKMFYFPMIFMILVTLTSLVFTIKSQITAIIAGGTGLAWCYIRAILAILLVILAIDLVVEGSKALAAQAKAKKAA